MKGNQVNYPAGMNEYKENENVYPYVQNVSNKGKLKFIKQSSIDEKGLNGAVFELYVPDNLNKEWTAEELKNLDTSTFKNKHTLDCGDGSSIESPALQPGIYLYREVKAPTGYTLDSELKTVVVKQNELVEVKVENIPQGKLIVYKYGKLSLEHPFKVHWKVQNLKSIQIRMLLKLLRIVKVKILLLNHIYRLMIVQVLCLILYF